MSAENLMNEASAVEAVRCSEMHIAATSRAEEPEPESKPADDQPRDDPRDLWPGGR
jgi:hypothetical protein